MSGDKSCQLCNRTDPETCRSEAWRAESAVLARVHRIPSPPARGLGAFCKLPSRAPSHPKNFGAFGDPRNHARMVKFLHSLLYNPEIAVLHPWTWGLEIKAKILRHQVKPKDLATLNVHKIHKSHHMNAITMFKTSANSDICDRKPTHVLLDLLWQKHMYKPFSIFHITKS